MFKHCAAAEKFSQTTRLRRFPLPPFPFFLFPSMTTAFTALTITPLWHFFFFLRRISAEDNDRRFAPRFFWHEGPLFSARKNLFSLSNGAGFSSVLQALERDFSFPPFLFFLFSLPRLVRCSWSVLLLARDGINFFSLRAENSLAAGMLNYLSLFSPFFFFSITLAVPVP